MSEPNRPVRTFRMGPMRISTWENRVERDGQVVIRHSATINKRYRDKDGVWRDSDSLFVEDLLRLAVLAKRAAEWIDLKEESPAEAEVAGK